jgi:hypothetical protein
MSAKKPTKAERAAKRKAKERAAARNKAEPLRPIDLWAASIVECYEALVRAGYGEDKARWYIEEKMRLPDWITPAPADIPHYDDDDDEDQ